MIETDKLRGKIDFGIISVREDEYRAVIAKFSPTDTIEGSRRYALATLVDATGVRQQIALVRCPQQGHSSAQQTAEALIADLNPRWILLVGIAGAVPATDFTLGDVVLGARISDFSVQAAIHQTAPEFDLRGSYAHPDVEDLLAYLPALEEKLSGWTELIGKETPSVRLAPRLLYGDDGWKKRVRDSLQHHFPKLVSEGSKNLRISTRERLFVSGTIATSNTLVKDADLVILLSRSVRSIMAFEMELGGVIAAARRKERDYPVLAVRGISDIIGYKREASWTAFACHAAAAFARTLIEKGGIRTSFNHLSSNEESKDTRDNREEEKHSEETERQRRIRRHQSDQALEYYVGSPDRPAPFGGRGADLEALDRWVNRPEGIQKMLLCAPAGAGKSALLAHWVVRLRGSSRALRVVYLAISSRFTTNQETAVLRYLASESAAIHRADHLLRPASDAGELRAVFHEFILRPPDDGSRVLVVLDGLDETAGWEVGPDVFPVKCPPHLLIATSARPYAGDAGAQGWINRLCWQHDSVLTPRLGGLGRGGVEEVLQRMGNPLEPLAIRMDVVSKLLHLTAGDPLLIGLYVEHLRRHVDRPEEFDPHSLDDVPPGLDGFFGLWFEDQKRIWGDRKPLLEKTVLALLNLCSLAKGPLTRGDVAALAPEIFPQTFLVDEAASEVKRFLIGDGRSKGYVFSHARLAQYFSELLLEKKEREHWNARFVAVGEKSLEGVRSGVIGLEDVSTYIVTYYGAHLDAANAQPRYYFQIISEPWYRACVHVQGTPLFLDYINKAVQRASRDSTPSAFVDEIKAQVWYSSIVSHSRNLVGSSLAALVRLGQISQEQALVLTRMKADQVERVECHLYLASVFPEPVRTRCLGEAIELLYAINDAKTRGLLALTIARLSSGDPFRRAVDVLFTAIAELGESEGQFAFLRKLLQTYKGPLDANDRRRTLDCCQRFRSALQRAEIRLLVSHLASASGEKTVVLQDILADVREIPRSQAPGWVVLELLALTSDGYREEWFSELCESQPRAVMATLLIAGASSGMALPGIQLANKIAGYLTNLTQREAFLEDLAKGNLNEEVKPIAQELNETKITQLKDSAAKSAAIDELLKLQRDWDNLDDHHKQVRKLAMLARFSEGEARNGALNELMGQLGKAQPSPHATSQAPENTSQTSVRSHHEQRVSTPRNLLRTLVQTSRGDADRFDRLLKFMSGGTRQGNLDEPALLEALDIAGGIWDESARAKSLLFWYQNLPSEVPEELLARALGSLPLVRDAGMRTDAWTALKTRLPRSLSLGSASDVVDALSELNDDLLELVADHVGKCFAPLGGWPKGDEDESIVIQLRERLRVLGIDFPPPTSDQEKGASEDWLVDEDWSPDVEEEGTTVEGGGTAYQAVGAQDLKWIREDLIESIAHSAPDLTNPCRWLGIAGMAELTSRALDRLIPWPNTLVPQRGRNTAKSILTLPDLSTIGIDTHANLKRLIGCCSASLIRAILQLLPDSDSWNRPFSLYKRYLILKYSNHPADIVAEKEVSYILTEEHPAHRAILLLELSKIIGAGQRDEILDIVLSTLPSVRENHELIEILLSIAEIPLASLRPSLVEAIVKHCKQISSSAERAALLGYFASRAVSDQTASALNEAVSAASSVGDVAICLRAQLTLLRHVTEGEANSKIREMVSQLEKLADPKERVEVAMSAITTMPVNRVGTVLACSLPLLNGKSVPRARAKLVALASKRLGGKDQIEALRQGLTAAQMEREPGNRAVAIRDCIEEFSPVQLSLILNEICDHLAAVVDPMTKVVLLQILIRKVDYRSVFRPLADLVRLAVQSPIPMDEWYPTVESQWQHHEEELSALVLVLLQTESGASEEALAALARLVSATNHQHDVKRAMEAVVLWSSSDARSSTLLSLTACLTNGLERKHALTIALESCPSPDVKTLLARVPGVAEYIESRWVALRTAQSLISVNEWNSSTERHYKTTKVAALEVQVVSCFREMPKDSEHMRLLLALLSLLPTDDYSVPSDILLRQWPKDSSAAQHPASPSYSEEQVKHLYVAIERVESAVEKFTARVLIGSSLEEADRRARFLQLLVESDLLDAEERYQALGCVVTRFPIESHANWRIILDRCKTVQSGSGVAYICGELSRILSGAAREYTIASAVEMLARNVGNDRGLAILISYLNESDGPRIIEAVLDSCRGIADQDSSLQLQIAVANTRYVWEREFLLEDVFSRISEVTDVEQRAKLVARLIGQMSSVRWHLFARTLALVQGVPKSQRPALLLELASNVPTNVPVCVLHEVVAAVRDATEFSLETALISSLEPAGFQDLSKRRRLVKALLAFSGASADRDRAAAIFLGASDRHNPIPSMLTSEMLKAVAGGTNDAVKADLIGMLGHHVANVDHSTCDLMIETAGSSPRQKTRVELFYIIARTLNAFPSRTLSDTAWHHAVNCLFDIDARASVLLELSVGLQPGLFHQFSRALETAAEKTEFLDLKAQLFAHAATRDVVSRADELIARALAAVSDLRGVPYASTRLFEEDETRAHANRMGRKLLTEVVVILASCYRAPLVWRAIDLTRLISSSEAAQVWSLIVEKYMGSPTGSLENAAVFCAGIAHVADESVLQQLCHAYWSGSPRRSMTGAIDAKDDRVGVEEARRLAHDGTLNRATASLLIQRSARSGRATLVNAVAAILPTIRSIAGEAALGEISAAIGQAAVIWQ